MRGGQYEKVVVEGKWERNAPACTNCSFGKPVQILDGDSDWCGDHLLSIKGIFFFRLLHREAELQSLDSAFEEAISDLSGLKISLIL